MSTIDDTGMRVEIESRGLREGNDIRVANAGTTNVSASVPLYADSSSKLKAGGFPFAVQLLAGTIDTSFSIASISGASTTTANDMMHQTLVAGANATFTTSGWARVTVTDAGGNIVTGAYYIPFGTLG